MSSLIVPKPSIGVLDPRLMIEDTIQNKENSVPVEQVAEFLAERRQALLESFSFQIGSNPNLSLGERMSFLLYGPRYIKNIGTVQSENIKVFTVKIKNVELDERWSEAMGSALGVKAVITTDSMGNDGKPETIDTDWVEFYHPQLDKKNSLPWETTLGSSIAIIAEEAMKSGARVALKKHGQRNPKKKNENIKTLVGIKPHDPLDDMSIFDMPGSPAKPSSSAGANTTPPSLVDYLIDNLEPLADLLEKDAGRSMPDKDYDKFADLLYDEAKNGTDAVAGIARLYAELSPNW